MLSKRRETRTRLTQPQAVGSRIRIVLAVSLLRLPRAFEPFKCEDSDDPDLAYSNLAYKLLSFHLFDYYFKFF